MSEQTIPDRATLRRVAAATLVGGVIEWYDFGLYGVVAALVFDKLFFPSVDPTLGTLASFGTFAVGFVARPLGGLVFGHFGDRVGRKTMLVITMLLMGLGTFAIGLLPTYATIGLWAPVALVALRFFQGFGVGGEWGGAVLVAMEHAPKGRRGLLQGFPQLGSPLGGVVASALVGLLSAMPAGQFLAWGWRIPFLLSMLLVPVGLYVRLRVGETPLFERVKRTRTEARNPIGQAFRHNLKGLLLTLGIRQAENGSIYLIQVFVLSYAVGTLMVPKAQYLAGNTIGGLIGCVAIMAAAYLTDRIGRRPVYMAGAAVVAVWAFPMFALLSTHVPALILIAVLVPVGLGSYMMYGAEGTLIAELFGTRHRYSGASIAYQFAALPAGGAAPFIATALVALAHGQAWAIAAYLLAQGAISFVCTLFVPDRFRESIGEDVEEPAVARAEVT